MKNLPNTPNGNPGIVNKIDPVVTNRLPTNGNTGIIKSQGNRPTLNNGVVNNKLINNGPVNNGPANNNAPQFHPVINNVRPTMVTTGNNTQVQSQGPARNFAGGNNMRSFHM